MFKLFSSTGPVFEGNSDQLRQHLGAPRSTAQPGTTAQNAPAAARPDPTRFYRNSALGTQPQQGTEDQASSTVASLMSRKPISITTLQNLGDAWQLMQRHNIAQLVVMAPPLQMVGMLTRTEVLKCLMVRNGKVSFVSGSPITELMQQPMIAVSETEDIRQAALLMLERDINALAVVDSRDQLSGVISRRDILGFLARARPLTLRA
uniref:CBS domain-containing protein n=1 Tax=Marinobacterium profundum TaxID=1714300 RepID=UPI00083191B0|nr:CBS domain-containing protein [Marinobacterium profundum]